MLPSKALYGDDKKATTSINNDNNEPPPPSYSESVGLGSAHSANSPYSSSPYVSGYHQRIPTAPPASLLLPPTDQQVTSPSISPSSPQPYNTAYGSISTNNIPDANDYNDSHTNRPYEQQPLISPSVSSRSPFLTSWKAIKDSCHVRCMNRKRIKKSLCLLVIILIYLIFAFINYCFKRSRGSTRVIMTSPYPLSPSHLEFLAHDKDLSKMPASSLTSLSLNFMTNAGEVHIVATDEPVSWISFSYQHQNGWSTSQGGGGGDPSTLKAIFTVHNATSLSVVVDENTKHGLVVVLHMSKHDRHDAAIMVEAQSMNIFMVGEDPVDMIEDLSIVLSGSRPGLVLPAGNQGWRGKHLRIKLQGNNGAWTLPRMEASGTIDLELTGMAGGDLSVAGPIKAGDAIKLKAKNGRITMANNAGSLEADVIELTTINSHLDASRLRPRRQCILRSTNGAIDATFLPAANQDLDVLDVQSINAAIHINSKVLSKRTLITSNLGSITMHEPLTFDGIFDVQSSLSGTTVQDMESNKIKFDVINKSIKQGRRGKGTRDHQVIIQSFAGSARLVFDQTQF
ncbi:uncharacterized protein BX664DRAFT_344397 [Halteromyces radiatus]|uniref:uncharacterized protein n=1 Tax=Halteromyces radiatus TaxID=101107 RepID=UPI00221E652E|nr:uncharacterized protein BX664DRAFT_344397 [Halteromyces radiatus]KAI8076330.1 hypothetical protein BX664DRAFT_344397 [Halteromyces radiatus]